MSGNACLAALRCRIGEVLADWPRNQQLVACAPTAGVDTSVLANPAWNHVHNTPEIFCQLGGTTTFDFPGGRHVLHRGEILIVPRLVPHQEHNQDRPDRFANLVLMLGDHHCGLHIARRLPRDHRHGIDKSSQIRIGDSALPAVIACCDHAARLQHEAGNDACRTSLLHSALRCLLDLAQRHQHNEQTNKNRTELCRDLIENNLSSNQLSVAQLARWLDCHPDYLCAGFRRTYGCAITTWIARRRLELAAHLLARRELPIAAVGWACGFRDPAYFSRRFRAHFGRPPREWRTAAHSAQPAQAPESGSTG